jgi:hypothetical protein
MLLQGRTVHGRRDHDPGAGFRVRIGAMMNEGDPKGAADVRKPGRVEAPHSARQPYRAQERPGLEGDRRGGCACPEHARLEARVVRGDERAAIEERRDFRPELREGRSVAEIVLGKAVNAREHDARARRGPLSPNAEVT